MQQFNTFIECPKMCIGLTIVFGRTLRQPIRFASTNNSSFSGTRFRFIRLIYICAAPI